MRKHITSDSASLAQRGPGGKILELLQRHGPMSTKQLQRTLGVSSLNAVREPLMSLAAAGLVRADAVRQGAGRPTHMYALTDKAQALFPKGYDILLRLLLEELVAQEGAERVNNILAGVGVRLAQEYAGHHDGEALEQRLAALSTALEARGTPINIVERDDMIVLHEYSCPYFSVAQTTNDVCTMEQQMMEQVLGRKVRLERRIVDGHTGCRFVIDTDSYGVGSAENENDNC